ncbi:hypothetical protein HanRHA438_Chr16g0787371 [Helianthus annuus]|nr:hypothetical protein HanRHA438_Chr16g0787371 [Helianthus annuus]
MGQGRRKKTFYAVILIGIWNMRNEVIFKGKNASLAKVVEETKALGYLWVKYRSKEVRLTMENWRNFNIFVS